MNSASRQHLAGSPGIYSSLCAVNNTAHCIASPQSAGNAKLPAKPRTPGRLHVLLPKLRG